MYEEATIEREASAPLLVQIIKENDIQGFVLDLDNTFLKTSQYYTNAEYILSLEIAESLTSSISNEAFAIEMSHILTKQYYERKSQPILVTDRYILAFEEYLGNKISNEEIQKINEFYEDFYIKSPEMIEGSVELLKLIIDLNLPLVFNSNAQDEWTRIKLRGFEELLDGFNLPYNVVDINKEKGPESWKESVKRINTPIERALLMGDSLTADILAGIAAGCRNIVWVNGDLNKLPLEVRENPDIHIWCVDSVDSLN